MSPRSKNEYVEAIFLRYKKASSKDELPHIKCYRKSKIEILCFLGHRSQNSCNDFVVFGPRMGDRSCDDKRDWYRSMESLLPVRVGDGRRKAPVILSPWLS